MANNKGLLMNGRDSIAGRAVIPQDALNTLGQHFRDATPLPEAAAFDDLLRQIDKAAIRVSDARR